MFQFSTAVRYGEIKASDVHAFFSGWYEQLIVAESMYPTRKRKRITDLERYLQDRMWCLAYTRQQDSIALRWLDQSPQDRIKSLKLYIRCI
jgi:hypothetical protein